MQTQCKQSKLYPRCHTHTITPTLIPFSPPPAPSTDVIYQQLLVNPEMIRFQLGFFIPLYRARILKLLGSSGIDSKASLPPAYVAWRPVTRTLCLLCSQPPHRMFKNPSSGIQLQKGPFPARSCYWSLSCGHSILVSNIVAMEEGLHKGKSSDRPSHIMSQAPPL